MCCRQLNYRFHERKIMNRQIATLKASGLITDFEGVWGSFLSLTATPHQEDCTDIDAFV